MSMMAKIVVSGLEGDNWGGGGGVAKSCSCLTEIELRLSYG